MLTNVGFDDAKQKVVVGSLSGGWKMKLALGEFKGGGGGLRVTQPREVGVAEL